jgi:hypothetical protein
MGGSPPTGRLRLPIERRLGASNRKGKAVMTREFLSVMLSLALTTPYATEGCSRTKDNQAQPQGQAQAQTASTQPQQTNQQAPTATPATPTADELYQLVAPIALFPDNLVAQVLAASTYPDQITAAHTWMGQNSSLKGDSLTKAVDKQPWDASVKALTQFPDVLNQMATNLSWTSALGDAYFNFPKDVMSAVQVMRQRAYSAGNLKSSQQQSVTVQNQAPGAAAAPAPAAAPQTVIVQPPPQTIVVQPAQPQVVYVPSYNPAVVYGAPVVVYPGYVPPPPPSTGAIIATGLISFGVGMAVGAAMSNSWGWNSWGCGWHSSTVVFNRNVYVSNSNTFVNRNNYYNRNNVNVNNINRNNVNVNNVNRNNINQNNYRANNFNSNARSSNFSSPNFGTKYNQPQFKNTNGSTLANNRGQTQNRSQNLNQGRSENLQQRQPSRGYEQEANRGTKSGAFSNYGAGGNARTNSARGQQSLNGGRRGGNFGGRRR